MRMNAYFPMSTGNPTGQRPWNFAMQGNPAGLGRLSRGRRLGLGRMGINLITSLPTAAQSQVSQIIQYLQQCQSDIDATNQLITQGTAAGVDMSDIAAQNNANQQQLLTYQSEFSDGYRALTGTVPPGLSGLGQVDPVSWTTITGAVVGIAALAALLYALNQQTSANKINAQARYTNAQASLVNAQTAAAACADDPTSAACQQAMVLAGQNPGGTTDWTTWAQNNWVLIAGFGALIFLGPSLIKKL